MLKNWLIAWLVIALPLSMCPIQAFGQGRSAQDYRLRAGDQLYVSAPQRPALNRRVVIEEDGNVTMPLIGQLPAAGLTLAEFQAGLSQAMQDFYPSISEVYVTIEQVTGQGIYVTGMVGKPGKYTFAEATNLWAVIREAGGPRPGAALTEVQIVKDEARGGTRSIVDVQSALEQGSVDRLPFLQDGDTVIIPREEERYTGAAGINVIGAVIKPGIYRLEGRQDLMSALLLAGGPTRRAKLSEVKVIQPQEDGSQVTEVVNLQRYLDNGDAMANPTLQPGFTVNVPEQNAVAYQFKNNAGLAISILTSTLSIAWLVIRIRDN